MTAKTRSARRTARQNAPLAVLAALIAASTLAGCAFSFGGNPDSGNGADPSAWTDAIPAGFDFAGTRRIEVSADVSIRVDGAEKPFAGEIGAYSFNAANGSYTLLGSGFISASSGGKGSFGVMVPTDTAALTLRPVTMGLFARDIAIDPATTAISLTVRPDDAPRAASRSLSRDLQVVGNTGLRVLSSYDAQGVPAALLPTRRSFSSEFLQALTAALPEYHRLPQHNAQAVDSPGNSNLDITDANAEIIVTFVNEGAGFLNSLGYFVYPTASPPSSVALGDIIVAFPNTSFAGSGGGLHSGDHLKLINPSTGGTAFSAGQSVGWVVLANGFAGNRLSNVNDRFYSIPSLNPEQGAAFNKAHVAFLKSSLADDPSIADDKGYVLAFEDLNRAVGDEDFNDVVFTVNVTPSAALATKTDQAPALVSPAADSDGDGVPDSLDAAPNDARWSRETAWPASGGSSTILYEDRWPSLGDYDFNDLVANLSTRLRTDAAGNAVEMKVDLRLRAAGGGMPSGLALTLPVAASKITGIAGSRGATGNLFDTGTNGVEPDGANSIIPIFASSHVEFGVAGGDSLIVNTESGGVSAAAKNYSFTVTFASGVSADRFVTPPDLFIVVNGDRSREVHALGKLPGGKANFRLFNTEDDRSDTISGHYYRGRNGAPWALLVPAELPWTTERANIGAAYPMFASWVRSGGAQYADWYQDKPGYRNPGLLY